MELFISFPKDSAQDQMKLKRQFQEKKAFPNALGAIDCTHVAIKAPKNDEPAFVNRKNFQSINTQVVCDADKTILNVVAKWRGCIHDAFIWNNSNLCQYFEEGTITNGWLLGKGSYIF